VPFLKVGLDSSSGLTGLRVLTCLVCSPNTQGTFQEVCGGSSPTTSTPPVTCSQPTPVPSAAVGQIISTALFQKFEEASKLASIAYCVSNIQPPAPFGFSRCKRFCGESTFSAMEFLEARLLF
jgi:hypothetical protein